MEDWALIERGFLSAACVLAIVIIFAGCDERPVSVAPNSSPQPQRAEKNASEKDEPNVISLTAKAATVLLGMIGDQAQTGKYVLRIRVVPGGCQGFMHKLDLDPSTSDEDHICESRGIKIALFKRQIDMLRGTEIDFGKENGKEGFKVENPNFKDESAKKWLPLLEKEKEVK
jgi:iron-sulfur cluster assembly protein